MLDTPAQESELPFDGFDGLPASLGADDLPRLREQLVRLEALPADARYPALLTRADSLTHSLLVALRPQFRHSAVPLSREARGLSVDTSAAFEQLARCHLRLLRNTGWTDAARGGLLALYRRFEVAALAGTTVPAGLWQQAGEMYRALGRSGAGSAAEQEAANRAHLIFVRLLALSCASPGHLSAGEIGDVVDWLDETMIPVPLHDAVPADADESWFWLDLDLDQGPHQFGRRVPPARPGVVCFSLAPLASHALACAALLAPEAEGRNAAGQDPVDTQSALLRRIADRYSNAHRRMLPRRRNNYRVAVGFGLADIRRLLVQDGGAAPETSEWMVVNESAGGFAIMHIGGHIEGIVSGDVIALRNDDEEPWTVCLVRWLRSDNPEHVELGLQILSNGAQAVDIAFRAGANGVRAVFPALLLPALPAVRPKFAILAPAGTYTSRRFVMVAQTEHVYVAQGRLISLDLQTAAIELFQFELDPYPI